MSVQPADLATAKKELRASMSVKRAAQDSAVALKRSRLAQAFILESAVWRKARSVALYMPIKNEASTDLLLKAALKTGKKVFLPRITDLAGGSMQFAPCISQDCLVPGKWNIPEPPASSVLPANVDLMLIPGLAFAKTGARLGYGGGFYDNFLNANPDFTPVKLGLCFAFQIMAHIPCAAWDIAVNGLCSEEGLHWA